MISPYPKGKGMSVMVWSGFVGYETAGLHRMARDETAKRNGYTAMNIYPHSMKSCMLSSNRSDQPGPYVGARR